ncbi:hypothetical protein [Allosediminivita pacifica]|uniref:Uncharacterized protein n=1 Tax=Allosediminivita pacifica TaxID=1267769 RepID=A0A2T6ANV8_9RHOB|nr:hypothetical protein [Allosediminivita pacifica]PTX45522.1 hypothetical protein C8N44_12144 [Allosediminivita pacifica]GGB20121.1 hypothetical protein GCM10011324_32760 [Allosediminivita pacifica]
MNHTFIFIFILMYLLTGATSVDPLEEFRHRPARLAIQRIFVAVIAWLPIKLIRAREDRRAVGDLGKYLLGYGVLVAIPYLFY